MLFVSSYRNIMMNGKVFKSEAIEEKIVMFKEEVILRETIVEEKNEEIVDNSEIKKEEKNDNK
jgi:hypothetical protein